MLYFVIKKNQPLPPSEIWFWLLSFRQNIEAVQFLYNSQDSLYFQTQPICHRCLCYSTSPMIQRTYGVSNSGKLYISSAISNSISLCWPLRVNDVGFRADKEREIILSDWTLASVVPGHWQWWRHYWVKNTQKIKVLLIPLAISTPCKVRHKWGFLFSCYFSIPTFHFTEMLDGFPYRINEEPLGTQEYFPELWVNVHQTNKDQFKLMELRALGYFLSFITNFVEVPQH